MQLLTKEYWILTPADILKTLVFYQLNLEQKNDVTTKHLEKLLPKKVKSFPNSQKTSILFP